jgi:hypothetical protein
MACVFFLVAIMIFFVGDRLVIAKDNIKQEERAIKSKIKSKCHNNLSNVYILWEPIFHLLFIALTPLSSSIIYIVGNILRL